MADDWPVAGLLAVVGVLLLVTAGIALTGVFGFFGSDGTGVSTESGTPTAVDMSTSKTGGTAGGLFTLETRDVETCGMLCRNVTSTVTNEQPTAARDVTIETRLYVGNDTDGSVRWTQVERIGYIGAGESYWATHRVELALEDALDIQDAGGWVTIRTTVESANRTVTVTERSEVT